MKDLALPHPIESPLLAERAGKAALHGFFTRTGGVSEGIYRGLNVGLGSKDERSNVEENRARVARWFAAAPERLASMGRAGAARCLNVRALPNSSPGTQGAGAFCIASRLSEG